MYATIRNNHHKQKIPDMSTPLELCSSIFFSRKMSFRLLQSIDEIILIDLEYRFPRQNFLHIFNVGYYVEHSNNCHNQF